ncbi:MAG: CPBP family intramembrane metalloprotease [Candidatus Bipolaricaulota bacterium]|nr:CPBP family intramembrane metalloprotease [Candidatus Bipolaricaulota bacterium]MDW8030901.1 type II CAAX endopeptidase family protein [Candidatus Bipolaricaulota bacterium]
MTRELHRVGLLVLAAFALWYFVFQTGLWNFWARLSLAATLLATSALIVTPDRKQLFQARSRDGVLGIVSALALYGIFWVGQQLALAILPFASEQIGKVYANRTQLDPLWIGLLLFFLVGPSEEIFWRGFVQRRLSEPLGSLGALFTTTAIYALVHIWTLNLMLILAAFVAGFVWGWLYQRERSLISVMLSHALWDVVIFVIFPLAGR